MITLSVILYNSENYKINIHHELTILYLTEICNGFYYYF